MSEQLRETEKEQGSMESKRKELANLTFQLGEKASIKNAEKYVSTKISDNELDDILEVKRKRYQLQIENEEIAMEKQRSEPEEKVIDVPYSTTNKRASGGGKHILKSGKPFGG